MRADGTRPNEGRPTDYSEELAKLICERLANGESLIAICKDETLPHRSTVHDWLNPKHSTYQSAFADKYARAREDQADYKADEIEDIANRVLTGEINPNAARVAIDAKKWTASKLRPKRYGDKLDVTSDNEKIQVIPLVDINKLKDEL